jgi:hypothetical protein
VSDDNKKTESTKPKPPARRAAGHRDQWFDSELNRIYDDVLSEPLPKDLAELVAKLKAKKSGS